MKKTLTLLMAVALGALTLQTQALAQKPVLDHSVYDGWKSIVRPEVPETGDLLIYNVYPQQGDGTLYIYNVRTGKEIAVERGKGRLLAADAKTLVCKISPLYQETRQAKIDKKKGDERPQDSLAIVDIASGKITKYPMLKSFKAAEKFCDYIAWQEVEKAPAKDKDEKAGKDKKKNPDLEEDQNPEKPAAKDSTEAKKKPSVKNNVYVLNIKTFEVDTLKNVDSYSFDKSGKSLAYTVKPAKKSKNGKSGIYIYNPATKEKKCILDGPKKASFGKFNFDKEGTRLAFYASLDTAKGADKLQDLYLWDGTTATKIIDHKAECLTKGWELAQKANVTFHDGYLTLGTRPIPREKDTTLVEFEEPKLDIWVWNSDYLMTIQKNNLQRDLDRTYLAKVNLDGTGFVQLADENFNIRLDEDYSQPFAFATSDKAYRIQRQWDYSTHADVYKVEIATGERTLLQKDSPFRGGQPSPDKSMIASFNERDNNWYLINVNTGEIKEISSQIGVEFNDDTNDRPGPDGAYMSAVWSEDGKYFWIRDKYDYWQIDPTGAKAPQRMTFGRENGTRYFLVSPYSIADKKIPYNGLILSKYPVYMTTFDEATKERGVARLDITKKKAKVETLAKGPYAYDNLMVSAGKKKPVIVYSKGNFETGNNLWITSDSFKSQKQLTDINPQQREYNWGTAELFQWTAANGKPADGILFKPENFDPAKKYPVIFYFYERSSENLFAPRTPAPSASTINVPMFVSNGYIVLMPDIWYTTGHPGESCMDYVMTAADKLCENCWVDGDNMAIQGQSWGGYQVAYIITHTNRFKAAGSGAPVSNMTSAYGGIRWESGNPRTAQYEMGQSRIGKTLWDGFDLYIENSPLFRVPYVTTPVLIMSNDADGAVPWWQGIEFFNGLRRCGKQAWLLQYNDEAHNLKERRNRKDLSIRMMQFFDYFLKGEKMPVWMAGGVPATLKGIEKGYGYVDETENN